MTPEELKALRTKHGLSQPAFAAIIDRSVDAVRDWEHGRRKIDAFTARAIRLMLKEHKQQQSRKRKR